MANLLERQTKKPRLLLTLVIVLLMCICVGLLIAVMKGTINHTLKTEAKTEKSRLTLETEQTTVSTDDSVQATLIENEISDSGFTDENYDDVTTDEEEIFLQPWEEFRLPRHIVPLSYNLTVQPNMLAGSFWGHVTIEVSVSRPTNVFIVHAYLLNITESRISRMSDNTDVPIREGFYYDPNEFWVLVTKQELLPEDTYLLHFRFRGSLVDSIVGFYRSSYTTRNGNETRFLATSKFQPTYARRAFPCFDEPVFKSRFSISIIHPPEYIALSNMPVSEVRKARYEDEEGEAMTITTFQESVPMVSYLVCFIVCDFNYTSTTTSRGTEVRVYATTDQVHKTKYALQIATKVLEFYENYFNISYPLPKQDMIAIPDFASGAMENWGLITYRETNLLYDEKESSYLNKQRVAEVISHELAHMWFGNLVTMDWWNDLWLNEGFASYIEYKGVNYVEPSWNMLNQFSTATLQPVLYLDSSLSSHPIVEAVSHPDEITEIFDAISYSKGASVLRMLEFIVGEKNFKVGISNFLKKFEYRNARTSDLWQEMAVASQDKQFSRSIPDVMNTWTNLKGFPYVSVRRDVSNSSRIYLKQLRYLRNPLSGGIHTNESPKHYVWSVPISYVTSTGEYGLEWIHDEHEKEIHLQSKDDWIKFNVNQTSYCLVNYEERDWERLLDTLINNNQKLSPADRSGVLFDAFQMAEAGHVSYDIPLAMTAYLKHETHLIPWETAYGALVLLRRRLEFTEVNPTLRNYIKELTRPLYQELGWNQTGGHMQNLLRANIIGLSCNSGNRDCLNEAVRLFEEWTYGVEIPVNVRGLAYRYGMWEGGRESHWNYMWNKYQSEESAVEKRKLLYGMAYSREPWLITRYLDYAMDETKIRTQDFFVIVSYIAGNPVGRSIVWNFIRQRWPELVARFTLNNRYLGRMVKTICDYFTTEFQLKEMELFFQRYPEAGAGARSRRQALENVRSNIQWLKTNKVAIHRWLTLEGRKPWRTIRLPHYIVPIHYDVTLYPNLANNTFTGTTVITIKAKEPVKWVVLHARDLVINNLEIKDTKDGRDVLYLRKFRYDPHEFLVIETDSALSTNTSYKLIFQYSSVLSERHVGLYKSSYVNRETQEKRYLAVTQFQPTYARWAFPCFDEPNFKATFSLTVIHDAQYVALSNMPDLGTDERRDGLLETRFQQSPPISTYMVCIIICDFEYKGAYTNQGTRFRVYAPSDRISKTQYSLDIGIRLLSFFEKHFDVKYPLPKHDMVALPDFGAGAMENWGISTYRETLLLYDETECSTFDKLRIVTVITHELAHMWFGNLVTLEWWDDLWLYEGLATYIEYTGADAVEPAWDSMDQFLLQEIYGVLEDDAKLSSHPIAQKVAHPNEISESFDHISYKKGAAVIRMLNFFIGSENFKKAVTNFLKLYREKNAKTSDMWRILSTVAPQQLDIAGIMDTWIHQMGYPVIHIRRDLDDRTLFHASQERFLINPDLAVYGDKHSPYGYVWKVPLSYHTSESNVVHIKWLETPKEVSFHVDLDDHILGWVKFNVNNTGYYLINYDPDGWHRMVETMVRDHEVFSPSDRANLLNDAFLLAYGGHIGYVVPLDMTDYLRHERHLVPWITADRALQYISRLLQESSEGHDLMQKYIQSLTRDLLANLTWNDEGSHLERRLRAAVIDLACSNEDGECLDEAASHLYRWTEGESIPPNLRSVVYRYGMWRAGNSSIWEYMWDQYWNQPTSPQEKRRLLSGMAFTQDEHLLNKYMEYATDESKIRRQDFFTVMSYIAANPTGRTSAWRFLRTYWPDLVNTFSINNRYLGQLVKKICSYFDTDERLQEMLRFFTEFPEAGAGRRAREEAIEQVTNNIYWLKRYKAEVTDWLRQKTIPRTTS